MHDMPHALHIPSVTDAQSSVVSAARQTWAIRPRARPHSTPEGQRDDDRKEGRRPIRDGGEDA